MATLTAQEQTNRFLGLICALLAVGVTVFAVASFALYSRPVAYLWAMAAVLVWGGAAYFGLSYAGQVQYRLTAAGYAYLVTALLIGVASVRSQMPLGFILFGAMIGALHVSVAMARGAMSAVDLRREAPERAWQNQTVHLGYFLRHTGRRGTALGLRVEDLPPSGVESVTGYCLHLHKGETFHAGGRFVARRRGRVRFQEIRLSTVFPFMLVRATKRFSQPASLVVWCARGRLTGRLLRRGARQSTDAPPSPSGGGQDEFIGLREYRSCDDNPRWIHWRRSAGRAQPVVREMARPLPDRLWLVLDTRTGEGYGDSAELEKRLRFAATLVDHAFSRGYQVGLALAGSEGPRVYAPAAGIGQRHFVQDALAVARQQGRYSPDDVVGALRPGWARESVVVLASGAAAPLGEGMLEALRRDCVQLHLLDRPALDAMFQDDPHAVAEDDLSAGRSAGPPPGAQD